MRYGDQRHEVPPVHPAQEEDAEGRHRHHHQGAEVGLPQQQPGHAEHDAQHRKQALLEALHHRVLAHGVVGRVQHGSQLHQLGRLEVEHDEVEPAPRAFHLAADAGDQDQDQQHHPGEEEPGRAGLPEAHRHHEGQRRGEERQREENALPDEEVGRIVAREPAAFRNGDGSRIDHHEARGDQQERRPRERAVVFGHGRALGEDVARHCLSQAP